MFLDTNTIKKNKMVENKKVGFRAFSLPLLSA